MNGKTVKKILMRHRVRSFWGKRAYLTVRLPFSLFPEAPPPRPEIAGESMGWEGMWRRTEGEHEVILNIGEVYSGTDPTSRDPGKVVYDLKDTPTTDEEDGTVHHSYRWWEIEEKVFQRRASEDEKPLLIERRPGSEKILRAYVARKEWIRKYLHGWHGDTGVEVLDRFLRAGFWAKTTYESVNDAEQCVYLTYSVKWFYPHRKFRFSADFSAAMKNAKRCGVDVRVLA